MYCAIVKQGTPLNTATKTQSIHKFVLSEEMIIAHNKPIHNQTRLFTDITAIKGIRLETLK
jgi:hypothetical protein